VPIVSQILPKVSTLHKNALFFWYQFSRRGLDLRGIVIGGFAGLRIDCVNRNFVTRACAFHRERAAARLSEEQLRTEEFGFANVSTA